MGVITSILFRKHKLFAKVFVFIDTFFLNHLTLDLRVHINEKR